MTKCSQVMTENPVCCLGSDAISSVAPKLIGVRVGRSVAAKAIGVPVICSVVISVATGTSVVASASDLLRLQPAQSTNINANITRVGLKNRFIAFQKGISRMLLIAVKIVLPYPSDYDTFLQKRPECVMCF